MTIYKKGDRTECGNYRGISVLTAVGKNRYTSENVVLASGGSPIFRMWSTSQVLLPSGKQFTHSGGVCLQIHGWQCGAYVGAVEEMMCVVVVVYLPRPMEGMG